MADRQVKQRAVRISDLERVGTCPGTSMVEPVNQDAGRWYETLSLLNIEQVRAVID
ncbi:hypothetical protein G3O00_06555 [Burkholderia sp. Ac-20384]|uniref:hypothetical protein n=1 Tax=Burkholderia TaxID=32008 RepID=UPI001583CA8E|nr:MULTISPECIES: hypothetical protein [Burkholderia]MBN3823277.1 hypothetical protein [Burkholderia sp. Ac-20384]